MSEDKMKGQISGSLVKAIGEIEGVVKDKINPHFKSKYMDLSSVLDAIRPVFAKYDMAVTQETSPSEDGIIVETVVLHASGEERRFGKLYIPANKRDAQGAGSALTYARRYSLVTAFGVPAEDDDGNAAVKATANPTTGEQDYRPQVAPKEQPGDISPTALSASLKLLVHNIHGCGDLGELEGLLAGDDVKDVIEQCQRRAPHWYETGDGMPFEFVPLKTLIDRSRKELQAAEDQFNNVRTPIDAG